MDHSDSQPNPSNLAFVEALYSDYLEDPASVPAEWRSYFAREMGGQHAPVGPSFVSSSLFNPPSAYSASGSFVSGHHPEAAEAAASLSLKPELRRPPLGSIHPAPSGTSLEIAVRQDRVDQLVRAYRVRGHMIANVDPLGLPRPAHKELDPATYQLTDVDLDRTFSSRTIFGTETLTLREILDRLRATYCRSIGVEFMHIHDSESKNWLQERMEGTENRLVIEPERQRRIFTMLTDASILEEFIQKKYLGAKSFSLEGSESLIPLLDMAIHRAAEHGVNEITLGMAHRGRLNVLANIMGKNPREIFREFEDKDPQLYRGRGDVKYHMGYSSDYSTSSGRKVHLSLCFNPSHLEYVNTVVLGRVRAKQDRTSDTKREHKLAILIHGDAAFIGEGIVQETFNLSELVGYHVGGTVHVVVNNQIGFTTSPGQSRSTTYCTDVAKMLQIPIFHVNGEDPEAVAQVVTLALDFRARFKRDVVVDMFGYRRHGHNETDEPSFTQPVLYKTIAKRPSVRDSYLESLLSHGGFTREEADKIAVERRDNLENELSAARQTKFKKKEDWLGGYWHGYRGGPESEVEDVDTGVERLQLAGILRQLTVVPEGFEPHPKLQRLFQLRRNMAEGQQPLDWGAAELCAMGSLVLGGAPVRMTGQDVERGTFSHRHAVVHDVVNGQSHMPLAHLAPNQAAVELHNSPLSEAGVLGFEWGYSLDCPEGLVIWEAQFGDFVNTAQVIIDQFICSAEDKWKRLSGLVLLLPHGFEGQGPEHSSARMERFLMLAAEDNMQVVQPSTPAQIFHLLRRQVLREWRKPAIVFSPKSLLRHPQAVSSLDDLATGRFERVISDKRSETQMTKGTTRVLLCSGKVYFELESHRQSLGRDDVAILRVEQLYPLPKKALAAHMEAFEPGTPVIWVQDEPENMGAWMYIRFNFGERVFGRFPLTVVSRAPSSSPATGSASSHRIEQQELIDRAFGVG
ncbi:MAG: 2-oxoglutarate dehydrogenase component [Pseudomonadota bacterium]|jgi:2-oxoglutarate dehydrogenase E1 component